MNNPDGLKFSKSDEWVKVEGNLATIGVTDYAQSQLSDIVYFEFKVDAGDTIKADANIVTLESVKAAADVNSPVAGKVVELNDKLVDEFEAVNNDPYAGGWMVKVEMSNPADLEGLMDKAAYESYCEERSN